MELREKEENLQEDIYGMLREEESAWKYNFEAVEWNAKHKVNRFLKDS